MDRGTADRPSAAHERPALGVRPPSALREWPLVAAMLTLAWLPPLAAGVALPVVLVRAGNPTAALLPVVVTLMGVLAGVVARRRIPGRAVRPRDEPELAALVQDVAERLGFHAPLLVRVVPDVQASLSRSTVSGIRAHVLVLGLPLLRTLTADQLAAVVAHELAHAQHVGHRRTSWLLMARHALAAELKPRFRPTAPVAAPLLRATQPRAWRTETDADADAARLLGRAATTAALERSIRLNTLYEGLGLRWWNALAQHDGTYPQDFYDALDTAMRDPHVVRSAARAVAEHDALDPYATAGHPHSPAVWPRSRTPTPSRRTATSRCRCARARRWRAGASGDSPSRPDRAAAAATGTPPHARYASSLSRPRNSANSSTTRARCPSSGRPSRTPQPGPCTAHWTRSPTAPGPAWPAVSSAAYARCPAPSVRRTLGPS